MRTDRPVDGDRPRTGNPHSGCRASSPNPPTSGSLYIQGNTEHTHGLTSSLLSNIAVRSGEILESIDAGRLTGRSICRLRSYS
ncbi:hypothetical protein [Mycolicibacterium psychrotolerans]|uniref:Uncharacterized protein n=1 Tax=Mycolicibacterium psychrotolerans TaxID=216929 RepID=A0A7I7MDH6_9MYCO|nr:hypothetical protein [Mycolicibacterium psychrotolerans]BBX69882.1 hypothetical protein MPSYJ_33430 [Mycolicibacterium psychrotolerans]